MVLCLSWWYTAGWRWVWRRMLIGRLIGVTALFSMPDMLRTLFAPYRQTFVGRARSSFDAFIRGLIDNTISRVIGFLVRGGLLLIGAIGCAVTLVSGLALLVVWAFLPLMPFVGILLLMIGFTG